MSKELKDLDALLDDEDELSDVEVKEEGGLEQKEMKTESEDERLKILRQHMNKVFLHNHDQKEESEVELAGNDGTELDDIFKDLNIDDMNVDSDNIENMLSSFINKMLHKEVLYPTLKEMLSTKLDSGKPLKQEKEDIIRLICDIYEEDDYSDQNTEQLEKVSVLVDKLESMDGDFQSTVKGGSAEAFSSGDIDLEKLTKDLNPDDCKMQ